MKAFSRLLTAALFCAMPSWAQAAGFGFKAPAGWLDLSPSAPSANFAQITPELAAQAKNKDSIFFAADVDHAKAEGFLANANAGYVSDKPFKVTKESLDEVADGMGAGFHATEKTLVDIGGVTVGRLVGDRAAEGAKKPMVQVAYLLPGADRNALLAFTTTKDRLVRDQPAFETAVRATTGLVEPPEDGPPGWVTGAATGVAVAIGLAINAVLQKRRNKNVWGSVEPVLRQGPKTLAEITAATGMTGLMARGKVVLALQEATTDGRVEVIPAPDGTPQLQKVNFIKYSLRA